MVLAYAVDGDPLMGKTRYGAQVPHNQARHNYNSKESIMSW